MIELAGREQGTPEHVVAVENASRFFGAIRAVSGVRLNITAGETFALLGPNGSGKSTLLRMMCGFLQPTHGDIKIGGHSILHAARKAQSMLSYVPDECELYARMRVREFLQFMAGIKLVPAPDIALRVKNTAQQLALESVLNTKIKNLSRGFRQRVAIAQALLNQPQVILLDEPTNGLDPVQIREWRALMKDLSRHSTVIFTSHVLDDVVALADRVGLLVDGELRSVAPLRPGTSRDELEEIFFAALSSAA